MSDVANLAGVSVSTVSHVINGTRKVAPETADAVHRAMDATGYRHNLAARALATQSTHTVGLVTAVTANPHFAELVARIEDGIRAAGYSLLLANTNDDAERAFEVVDHLLARRVSGMFVAPVLGNAELDNELQTLATSGYPLVLIDRRSNLPVDQVYSDGHDAMRDATIHLAHLGHRRIGFITGEPESMSAEDRYSGYRDAMLELGFAEVVLPGQSDERITRDAVIDHFSGGEPVTALVIANNLMTTGTLRALNSLGLRVGDDVALECYDDLPWTDLLDTPLSAAAQDTTTIASRAIELLLGRLGGSDHDPHQVVVPTIRQHRASCGCVPAER